MKRYIIERWTNRNEVRRSPIIEIEDTAEHTFRIEDLAIAKAIERGNWTLIKDLSDADTFEAKLIEIVKKIEK